MTNRTFSAVVGFLLDVEKKRERETKGSSQTTVLIYPEHCSSVQTHLQVTAPDRNLRKDPPAVRDSEKTASKPAEQGE